MAAPMPEEQPVTRRGKGSKVVRDQRWNAQKALEMILQARRGNLPNQTEPWDNEVIVKELKD